MNTIYVIAVGEYSYRAWNASNPSQYAHADSKAEAVLKLIESYPDSLGIRVHDMDNLIPAVKESGS